MLQSEVYILDTTDQEQGSVFSETVSNSALVPVLFSSSVKFSGRKD